MLLKFMLHKPIKKARTQIKSKENTAFKNSLEEKTRNKIIWQHNWRLSRMKKQAFVKQKKLSSTGLMGC